MSWQTLARLIADAHVRQVVWNTVSLAGRHGGCARHDIGNALCIRDERVALPWKRAWHFVALLPTISPPILMALSLILLYGRRGLITHEVLGLQTTALYGFSGVGRRPDAFVFSLCLPDVAEPLS